VSHKTVLKNLIFKIQAEKVAEIGVYKGGLCRSVTKNCREVLKEYWAIDPWVNLGQGHGKASKHEDDKYWHDLYLLNCERMINRKALRVIRALSVEAVKLFLDEYFDIVYLDGDHHYDVFKEDLFLWLPKVKVGGILAGHDYRINFRDNDVSKVVHEVFGKDFETGEDWTWWKQL